MMTEGIAISPELHELIQHYKSEAEATDLEDLRHALECSDSEHPHYDDLWDEIDRLAAEYGQDCHGPFFVRRTEE